MTDMTSYSYYIYFRVAEQQTESLESRIHTMQAEIKQTTGIAGRLMKKRGEPLLWMEVYESVSDIEKFERVLTVAVEKFKLVECLQPGSSRKTECFG